MKLSTILFGQEYLIPFEFNNGWYKAIGEDIPFIRSAKYSVDEINRDSTAAPNGGHRRRDKTRLLMA